MKFDGKLVHNMNIAHFGYKLSKEAINWQIWTWFNQFRHDNSIGFQEFRRLFDVLNGFLIQ